jgi:methylglutaconyl-CoA hydratase
MAITTLKTELVQGVFTVSINRPEVRNAFNDRVILDFQEVFDQIINDSNVRVVVIKGEGPVFCAGGDLQWMKDSLNLASRDNLEDTKKLARMFDSLNSCPKPVVGLVHGAAIGGGVGLVSVCDYVIASKETLFSLAEVRVGIIPACIGPFVLAKIGETHARSYFISAERFDAHRAKEIGLIHEVVEKPEQLNDACQRILTNLKHGGPNAIAAAKKLIHDLRHMGHPECLDYVAKTLADLRVTPEGQEGLKAFLEKRKPNWVQ